MILQARVDTRIGAKVDRLAKRKGLTRAGYMKMVIHEHLDDVAKREKAAEAAERRQVIEDGSGVRDLIENTRPGRKED